MIDKASDATRWLTEQAPRLILFARQWVPCHADAEDVFHTAFVRFWQQRDRVRDPVAYLYTCVRSTALNWLRQRSRQVKHEQSANANSIFAASARTDSELRDGAGQLVQAEIDQAIQAALSKLDHEQREVVVMRVWGELSFPQIGEVLEISSSTADTRYRTGLKILRLELQETLTP